MVLDLRETMHPTNYANQLNNLYPYHRTQQIAIENGELLRINQIGQGIICTYKIYYMFFPFLTTSSLF